MSQELDLYTQLIGKMDKTHEALYLINARLVAIETDLRYHVERTNLLETQMKHMDRDVNKLKGFFSIGGWIVAIAATILTIADRFWK